MIDIKFLREHPDIVKENIKKKFQDQKLILVDEVLDLDKKYRESKLNGDNLRSERKSLSNQIGNLMKSGEKLQAEEIKQKVQELNERLEKNELLEDELAEEINSRIMNHYFNSVFSNNDDTCILNYILDIYKCEYSADLKWIVNIFLDNFYKK